MQNRLTAACAALLAALTASAVTAPAWASEENIWPAWVAQKDDSTQKITSWQAVGPIIYKQPSLDQLTASGVRPLYLQRKNDAGIVVESNVLYPFFTYRRYDGYYRWSVFNLINRTGTLGQGPKKQQPVSDGSFDIWPFYFSRNTGSPDSSYKGLLPIGGQIKNRLGYDRLSWVLFPLYGKTEKRGVTDTFTPWPFIRTTQGNQTTGFAFWPIYGHREKPNDFAREFYLWPLGYKSVTGLSDPQPVVKKGFLPFYALESGPRVNSATYGWPFFGWVSVTDNGPKSFHEKHYFWPFFVQAKGEQRTINRWAPFYSHSHIRGTDKTWVLWPAFKRAAWNADNLDQTQHQFLFFVYWSLKQESPTNPNLAPAYKKHLWPLFTVWDNGAGRKQVQALSPFEVFFPRNDTVRESWTPLFALYRYNRAAPDKVSNSLLWNAVTWKRDEDKKEFRLGPIFSVERGPERNRIALLSGVLGFKRKPGKPGWRPFLFDFSSSKDQAPAASR